MAIPCMETLRTFCVGVGMVYPILQMNLGNKWERFHKKPRSSKEPRVQSDAFQKKARMELQGSLFQNNET